MTASPSDTGSRPETKRREDVGSRARGWWRELSDPHSGDPGTLAQLRRARTALEALMIPGAVALVRRLGAASKNAPTERTRDVLDLARVLAHAKENSNEHPMRAAGWKGFAGNRKESDSGGDRPKLAEARFKRLLQTGEGEERVAAFVRLIALLGGSVKIDDLARDFLDWNHPARGDRIRERWAFLYYDAGDAAPSPPDHHPSAAEDEDE